MVNRDGKSEEKQQLVCWIRLSNGNNENEVTVTGNISFDEEDAKTIEENFSYEQTDRKEFKGRFVLGECGGY